MMVLVDTGSHMSMVRVDLVDKTKLKEETAKLECVHGDSVSYSVAQISVSIDGWTKELSVAVVPKLPVDLLISWKDYTAAANSLGTASLAVLTRSQRRKQMEQTRGCEGGG